MTILTKCIMKKFITILLFISFATIVSGQDDGFYGPSEKSDPKQEMKEKRQQKIGAVGFWRKFLAGLWNEFIR
jgi:hypothetical protein